MPEPSMSFDEQLELAHSELERLVRRLRGLSVSAWRSREVPVFEALQRLAQLDGMVEQRPVPGVPDLETYALADAVAVVGGDVLAALGNTSPPEILAAVINELRSALDATL